MPKAKKTKPSPLSTAFDRPIMLHVCKDGTLTYRDKTKREKVFNGVALPVFSVNTVEQAKQIQTRFCTKQYGPHPHPKGPKDWYVLTHFSGELDDLDRVMANFASFWAERIDKTPEAKRLAHRLSNGVYDKLKRRAQGVE